MYSLTEAELEQLAEVGTAKTLDLTVASMLFGALTTVIIWLATVGITSPVQTALAVAAIIAIVPSLSFFGIRAYRNYRMSRALLKRFTGKG